MTMELEQFKSDWNEISISGKNTAELKSMLSENKHPVLRGIRSQLSIEIFGWSAFLICYYSMFDGDQKPLMINCLLVVSVLISFFHNLWGYRSSKYLVQGGDLLLSLKLYLKKMQRYALISIVSRILFATGLLIFFSYNINLTNARYLALAVGVVVIALQIGLLVSVWNRRLKSLKISIEGF